MRILNQNPRTDADSKFEDPPTSATDPTYYMGSVVLVTIEISVTPTIFFRLIKVE